MQYKGHNITIYHNYQAVCINGKRRLLHRVVAEDILGRPLKNTEVVHHIDENKFNNNPDNLMVFKTTADHTAFHNGAEIYKDGDVWVAKFKYIEKDKERENKKIAKLIPTKQELQILLNNNYNYTQIGQKYGVVSNTVKKWLKKYDLYEYQFYDLPEINNFLQIASSVNTIKELCTYYNCSSDTIYRFIRDLGLELQREQIVCETLQKNI